MLEEEWPTTLGAWGRNENYLSHWPSTQELMHATIFHDDLAPEPRAAIRLARCCHVTSILPAALSRLPSTYPRRFKDADFEGANVNRDKFPTYLYDGGRTMTLELLSPEDCQRLINGREALRNLFRDMTTDVITVSRKEHPPRASRTVLSSWGASMVHWRHSYLRTLTCWIWLCTFWSHLIQWRVEPWVRDI